MGNFSPSHKLNGVMTRYEINSFFKWILRGSKLKRCYTCSHTNLLGEFWRLDLHKVHLNSSEVAVMGTESHASRPDRILVFVGINSGVHDISEQLVHGVSQAVSVEHAMESTYKHCFAHVKLLRRAHDGVAVRQNPGDDLYLEKGGLADG